MKRSILLFLYLLINLSNSFGIDKDISLIWKDNDKFVQNALPFFSGANSNEKGIPIYTEVIPDNGDAYQLVINSIEVVGESLIADKTVKLQLDQNFKFTQTPYKQRKQSYIQLDVCPFRLNKSTGAVERIVSFSIKKDNSVRVSTKSKLITNEHSYVSSSVLKTGKWFKIRIEQTGVQKITYSQLKALGLQNPENVRVYGNGGEKLPTLNAQARPDDLNEIPIQIVSKTSTFQEGDYILFYADKPISWKYDYSKKLFTHNIHPFSSYSYCFLTSDLGSGKQIQTLPEPTSSVNKSVSTYDDYDYRESNIVNLLKSGAEWYGESFNAITTSSNFNFSFSNLLLNSTAKVYYNAVVRATNSCVLSIKYNSSLLGTASSSSIIPTGHGEYASSLAANYSFNLLSNSLAFTINFDRKSNPDALAWLNYIGVNVRRNLVMESTQLMFRDQNSIGVGNVAQFNLQNTTSNTVVWDITQLNNVSKLQGVAANGGFSFKANADSIRQYIAFDFTRDGYLPTLSGDGLGLVENQDLHGKAIPQFIIVTHPDFVKAANELASYRKNHDNLNSLVVTTNQIYNEFSSGMPDVSAIRNFVKMFYDKASTEAEMPRYLLLMGDGSYNNFSTNKANPNFIPTYESANSINENYCFVSDDFFGLLDDNEGDATGLTDISIGRFPIQTVSQADSIVGKIKRYESSSNFGQWRNQFCFLADDDNNNLHSDQSNLLAEKVKVEHPTFNIEKIFLDAYQQITTSNGESYPEVNKQFEDRIRKGALVINYTGHGGVLGLTNEKVISIESINNYDNYNKLFVFVTASCEFSRWDDIDMVGTDKFNDKTSAGELTLLNNKGGAVALFTTTRVVYADQNFDLNNSFYNFAFKTDPLTGSPYRLGDVVRLAKNEDGSNVNNRNFTLLGDPALKLANPTITTIRTDSINHVSVDMAIDTLKALSKVFINGSVCDANGVKDPTFTGTLSVTIFDKELLKKNLQNEGQNLMTFTAQENVIYKGKVSVVNGLFQYSFIVPKDINFSYGYGKISYYAENGTSDRSGVFNKAIIGGLSKNGVTDSKGPTIKLGLNTPTFVNGSVVNSKPNLMAVIEDENGINTSGIGIGHDITAILDDNTNNKFVLNDYYEADKDSYVKGKLVYPFASLTEGKHKLKLKVWDVANNSSETAIEFVVTENEGLSLQHVLNYPNPFTTQTNFYFNHNRPGQLLDIQIQIFTVAGKLVKTIRTTSNSTGFISEPIFWNGRDDFGDKIGRGVYIYRLKVRDQEGKTAEKYEKLLILH